MSKKNQVNCPKCPMKVYIRKRRDSDQYFITDTKDRKAECHRNTCASGEFIDSDILNSYRSNEKIDLRNEYRGIFGQLQMWTDVVSLATKFNQYYSHLLNGKKMFIVKYTNENYIRYKTRFTHIPKDYYKTDFIPIIVESYLGESLIWVCTNKYHSDDDSSISNREKLNYYGLKYNKFYLFDRKNMYMNYLQMKLLMITL
ncbi:MAG: hypothetical protein NTV87_02715 [Ignavibacteriae bacterium]|nr:hypothetical protein [Ignavibacteriota bacterium]